MRLKSLFLLLVFSLLSVHAVAGLVLEDDAPKRIVVEKVGEEKPGAVVRRWEIRVQDITLSKTFERWAEEAGYRVRWDAKKNILIEAPDVFVGTFEQALRQALASPGILYGDHPLEACIYPNSPLLARVTRQGEQLRECPEVVPQ